MAPLLAASTRSLSSSIRARALRERVAAALPRRPRSGGLLRACVWCATITTAVPAFLGPSRSPPGTPQREGGGSAATSPGLQRRAGGTATVAAPPPAAAAAVVGPAAEHLLPGPLAVASGAAAAAAAGLAAKERSGDDAGVWLPRALLFLFAVFCSTNFTLVKVLEDGHSEAAVAASRFGVAAIPFLALLPQHLNWKSISSGVEIGLWCVVGYLSQAVGLQYTEASKGAFICSLAMVVVPVVKALCGERVKPQLWGAVLLAAAGTSLLLGGGVNEGPNIGDVICSGTAIGFGLMFVRMDHHAKDKGFSSLGCTIWQVVTLAVAMCSWLLWSEGPHGAVDEVVSLFTAGPSTLAILFWVGIITTAGVLYVETWAMERVDGTEAGIIFASEPVWATLFASVVLGESFGAKEGVGAAIILIACLLTQLDLEGKPAISAKEEQQEAGLPA